MFFSPLSGLSPLGRKSSGASTPTSFNLASALHEWNYQNSTEVGTTVTAVDSGSIGGLNMANPTASQKPTLNGSGWVFDGVNDILEKSTTNFRGGDSVGVVHAYINFTIGTPANPFTCANSGLATNYFTCNIVGANKPQVLINDGSNKFLRTTATIGNGMKLISVAQNGSGGVIFLDGVKITTYDTSTLGTLWFNSITTNNIAMGATKASTPFYTSTKVKYVAYCPYVNEATIISEATQILAAGL